MLRLVKLGILREVTGRTRDRIFMAPEILQLTGASDLGEQTYCRSGSWWRSISVFTNIKYLDRVSSGYQKCEYPKESAGLKQLARVFVLLTTILGVMPAAFCQDAVRVTPCQLKSDPASYNHNLLEITGFVSHGFEDFTLFDPACATWPDVWLEYGGTVNSGTMYCCGVSNNRSRPHELEVEGIAVSLVDNEAFRTFDRLIQRDPDSIVRATIIGRFFAGADSHAAPGNLLRGYGHLGCCSLLAIQQVLAVDSQNKADLDYRAYADESRINKAHCGYRQLVPSSVYSDSREAQKAAESGQKDWAFAEPERAARDSLARVLQIDERSIQGMKQIRAAQGRLVYEWRPRKRRTSYVIVVSRPYWLSFYSADPRKVAWVAIADWESPCG